MTGTGAAATTPVPVIDTHLHVWRAAAPWMAWLQDRPASWQVVRRDFAWSELRDELDRAGVAELILVQAGMDPAETRQLLELAADQPTVLGVVGWASLTSPQATERDLASLPRTEELVGIRSNHGWAPDGDVLARTEVVDSCRVLAERGLPLDLHVRDHTELPLAVSLAERVPQGTYVIDHIGKPVLDDPGAFEPWSASMRTLSEMPHVYVKLSGWATAMPQARAADLRPYAEFLLDAFGSERVMYGGNWPVALVAGDYRTTYRATMDAIGARPAGDVANVLRHAARTCYLGAPAGGGAPERSREGAR